MEHSTKKKRIHFIAIGGSAMHNLALAMQNIGFEVTGSDDDIFEPAFTRLQEAGLLPTEFGWNADRIDENIDVVILGMHAKKDNPELLRAQALQLRVVSYPEFLAEQSASKKRVVIAGSHGKTTTTSIILHVLKYHGVDFDYLVGAQIEGFDRMVQLSDAPLIIIEGDEYLSSPIDLIPKIHHYRPHISVITGIAWDHINVFPTFSNYVSQFRIFLELHEPNGICFWNAKDDVLQELITSVSSLKTESYTKLEIDEYKKMRVEEQTFLFPLIGEHNLQNAEAARKVCLSLGISEIQFFEAFSSFPGPKKRLQRIWQKNSSYWFLDFAHAPSKLVATIQAVKDWFPNHKVIGIYELHTFSSLDPDFLPSYAHCMDAANEKIIFIDQHTMAKKGRGLLSPEEVKAAFQNDTLEVCYNTADLEMTFKNLSNTSDEIVLWMSSGNFGGLNLTEFSKQF